jgi:hypothetical protein
MEVVKPNSTLHTRGDSKSLEVERYYTVDQDMFTSEQINLGVDYLGWQRRGN